MRPSLLFHTILKSDLDYVKILALVNMSWPEICVALDLPKKVCRSISDNEGRAITRVAVETIKRDNEIARQDQLETERDLAIAQGARI